MCRRIISQEKKSLGGLNPRGILVREENFGGKPTGRKKFGGKMGPSHFSNLLDFTEEEFSALPSKNKVADEKEAGPKRQF